MAKNTLGSASLILGANSRGLRQGLNKARQSMGRFRLFATKTASSISAALGPILAVAAPLAVFAGGFYVASRKVSQAFEDIDKSAKMARRLGIATETFSALEIAADQAGLSQEQFAGGIRYLNTQLSQAQRGIQGAVDKFRLLGISEQQLAGKSNIEALEMVADQISQMAPGAQRAALAAQVLGEEMGGRFVSLLEQGGQGIRAFIAEQQRLGNTFTDAEARMVESANDSWSQFYANINAIWRRLAITLAPAVKEIGDSLQAAYEAARPLVRFLTRVAGMAMGPVIAAFRILAELARTIGAWVRSWGLRFVSLPNLIGPTITAVKNMTLGVIRLGKTITTAAADFVQGFGQRAMQVIHTILGQMEGMARFGGRISPELARVADSLRGMQRDMPAAMRQLTQWADSMRNIDTSGAEAQVNAFFERVQRRGQAAASAFNRNLRPPSSFALPRREARFRPATMALRGSQEAITAILHHRMGSQGRTAQQRAINQRQQQLAQQRQGNRLLERIREQLAAGGAGIQAAGI